uniref:Olfactory receptor C family, b1 n=1 Tax=Echeneis naucrates TaxID=173247 RepID=A0A665WJI0_ECHNA
MLPCHQKVKRINERIKPDNFLCSDFDLQSFLKSLATIHEIEEINAAGFLPGVHLGYLMCDTCSDASKALRDVGHMLAVNNSLNVQCNYTDLRPTVKIILGALYSEVSIALARLLNVYMVPLLSSTSSSPELSDKLRYPVFLRTVPSDYHQTKAVAKLMHHYNWNWVGVVYGDDEYGKAAFQSFLEDATANAVCMAYHEMLSHDLNDSHSRERIKHIALQIRSSSAKVVLLILKAELVEALFEEMIRTNTSRIWIASDVWSRSWSLAQMHDINRVGDILGFTFVASKSEKFDRYLQNLTVTPGGYNFFIEEYKNLRFNSCNIKDPHEVAVWAVANALKKLLNCPVNIEILPYALQLLKQLKEVSFTLDNQNFQFDKNGDFVNGYDLIFWEKYEHHRRFRSIGKYHAHYERIDVESFTWFSSDLDNCKKCPNGTWSLKGWDHCEPRWESFMQWSDPHPIALLAASAFGILLLLVMLIIFLVYRDSPPMKRAEVRLSCVIMAGLAVSFASVICFMGRPTVHLCRARQVMYAMGFTLCVSCILVKAYRTFLAFLPFGQITNRHLHKLYRPSVIVTVITSLQGIICLLWLILDSPHIDDTEPPPQTMKHIIQCTEGDRNIGFTIMLSYIALLALIGFLLAFKGRKVPQKFSETGYIIFSMLMYLFVWVCFIPVYITNKEKGSPVQASAILVSSYGIIFCHFLPKCYEALCRPKDDPLERILRRWQVISGPNPDSETCSETYIHNTTSQNSSRTTDQYCLDSEGLVCRDGDARDYSVKKEHS